MLEKETRLYIDKKLQKVGYKLENTQVVFEYPLSKNNNNKNGFGYEKMKL